MDKAEFKAASEMLLHPSRHSDGEASDMIGKLLAQLPESPETAELSETLLHRWRHSNAVVADSLAKLLAAVKPA